MIFKEINYTPTTITRNIHNPITQVVKSKKLRK